MELEDCLEKIKLIDHRAWENNEWFEDLGISVLPNSIAICTAFDFAYNCIATQKQKPLYIDPEPFGGIMFWFMDMLSFYPIICSNQGQILRHDYIQDYLTGKIYLYNIYPVTNN